MAEQEYEARARAHRATKDTLAQERATRSRYEAALREIAYMGGEPRYKAPEAQVMAKIARKALAAAPEDTNG